MSEIDELRAELAALREQVNNQKAVGQEGRRWEDGLRSTARAAAMGETAHVNDVNRTAGLYIFGLIDDGEANASL